MNTQIEIYKGSVLDAQTDAIVNPTDQSLSGGGTLDRAIHKAAGQDLHNECSKLKLSVGQSLITGAYNLAPIKYIIHTVGPRYRKASGLPLSDTEIARREDHLTSCYITCLDLALKAGCKSIAFPCIATGAFGYPVDEAAKIAVTAIGSWLDEHPNSITVEIYCYKEEEYKAYFIR